MLGLVFAAEEARVGMGNEGSVQGKTRCAWAAGELAMRYHDEEWGVPLHDDRRLFEFIILDGAQAGLSWNTILKKRENFRVAFDGFDPALVASYGRRKMNQLLKDPGIIRNRLKIAAAIQNARVFLSIQKEFGTFDAYIWQFIGGKPRKNRWRTLKQVPVTTPESDAMSKDLIRRGFRFVGSTICYAFMQAAGMVNDHTVDCFRYHSSRLSRGWHILDRMYVMVPIRRFHHRGHRGMYRSL